MTGVGGHRGPWRAGVLVGLRARPPGWAEENTWPRVGHSWPWRGATFKSIRMAIWAGVAWAPAVHEPPGGAQQQVVEVSVRAGWPRGLRFKGTCYLQVEGRRWSDENQQVGLRAEPDQRRRGVADSGVHWSSSPQAQPWPGTACPRTPSTPPRPPTPPEGHGSSCHLGRCIRCWALAGAGWFCFRTKLWTWTA